MMMLLEHVGIDGVVTTMTMMVLTLMAQGRCLCYLLLLMTTPAMWVMEMLSVVMVTFVITGQRMNKLLLRDEVAIRDVEAEVDVQHCWRLLFALRANVVHPVPAAVFSEYSVSTVCGRPLSTARNTPTPQNARRLRPTAPSNPKLTLCMISHGA